MKPVVDKAENNMNENLYESDEEQENNEEIDMINALVKKSVKLLKPPSNDTQYSQSFQNLTKKLLQTENNSSPPNSESNIFQYKSKASTSTLAQRQLQSEIYDKSTITAPSLKKAKESKPETLGKGWFDSQPMKLDENLKRDIKLLEMRNFIDPKRFYKKTEKIGKVLHVGTVIEGPHEYKSHRLKNSDRKRTITEELLADQNVTSYTKNTYNTLQKERANKRRKPLRKMHEFKTKSMKKKINNLF